MNPYDTSVAKRWFTRTLVTDADGLVTTLATATSAVLLDTEGELTGVEGALLFRGYGPARTVSVTNSSSTGAYVTANPIVVTGIFNDQPVTENLTLTTANGGQTVSGSQPFDRIVSIAIPAQANTAGAWTFGVGDIVAPKGRTFRGIRASADGNVLLRFDEDRIQTDDTAPMLAGEKWGGAFTRVLKATTIGVTVYF